ncbi:ABC transporter ATP-binding protein [Ereboglobus luteus]|uniref:ABC transporter n=1 Tax=Ereboglobus luteus TaxID=1796921 RepID=A0A2U8DZX7_9BACT|nr:ABC transporter ATP-binding protein [Ereboglobus luteus]AWI08148.1 ABC transporter [Ereboglobus luteus]
MSDPNNNPLEHRFEGEHPVRTLLYLYRNERFRLLLGLLFMLIKHSPIWIMPLMTARIIDVVTNRELHPLNELWVNSAILLVVLLQNIPFHYLYVQVVSRAVRSIAVRLRSSICRRLQQLSIGYFSKHSTGVFQSKVLRDVDGIEQFTRNLYDTGIATVINIIFAFGVTALRAPSFLLVFVIAVPVAILLIRLLRKRTAERNRALRMEVELMSSRVNEMASLISITRAHGLEGNAIERVESALERVRAAGLRVDQLTSVFGASSWVIFNCLNMGCLIFAAWACYTGFLPITAGDVVMLTGYFTLITNSVLGLTAFMPQVLQAFEAVHSIGEVLQSPDLEHNENKAVVTNVDGAFRFEKTGYTYEGAGAPAVHDFTLDVQPGQTIALVGASGSGKSTLLNLVIGFIRPTEGRILLDGADMVGLDLRVYRHFLSVVPQESILFEGTIRENITYGLVSATDDIVEKALRDANAWEFVSRLPDGIETRCGERGARLSGGQKQRLAIARALIRNPRVLILDEATSALDTESEALVQEALQRLMAGRTTFVVAHRLSTIRNADKIVVMRGGRIAEIGTHSELLDADGLYAQMNAR